jgi:hypothetical protein
VVQGTYVKNIYKFILEMGKYNKNNKNNKCNKCNYQVNNYDCADNDVDCYDNHETTIDDCNAPYIICRDGELALNVTPSCCILQNPVYLDLYNRLYDVILDNRLDLLLANAIKDETSYNAFVQQLSTLFDYTTYRLEILLSDSSLVFDSRNIGLPSYSSVANTYANFRSGRLGAPASRPVVFPESQIFPEGTGYNTRNSSATLDRTAYVGIRLGPFRNSVGTAVLSIDLEQTNQANQANGANRANQGNQTNKARRTNGANRANRADKKSQKNKIKIQSQCDDDNYDDNNNNDVCQRCNGRKY